MTEYQTTTVRFERKIAGGLVLGYIPDMGLVVFTSISVPITTSWWIIPGTMPEEIQR